MVIDEKDAALIAAELKIPDEPRFFPENRHYQGIPGITVTPAGSIYAVWYSGGNGECPENFCIVVRSRDGGKSWTDPLFVIDHTKEGVRCFDPAVWVDPQGRLWLFWAQSFSEKEAEPHAYNFDGRSGVWAVHSSDPDADRPVFSPPVRIANGIMLNKPVVLSNGDWGLPTAVWQDDIDPFSRCASGEVRKEIGSNLTVSTDQGKTFTLRGGANVPERCFDENICIELTQGHLRMFVRTFYGIGQSDSFDNGCTWTPGVKTAFRSPNARFHIRRLASGRLLFLNDDDDSGLDYHQHTWRPRHNLTAYLSDDNGETWSDGFLIDIRAVSYPDAWQTQDGIIHIIYDCERYKAGYIFYLTLTEEEILRGTHPVQPKIISCCPYSEGKK